MCMIVAQQAYIYSRRTSVTITTHNLLTYRCFEPVSAALAADNDNETSHN